MFNKKGLALFVSGVDTDAGKTYVTARLAAMWLAEGHKVITQKPVQTGCLGVAEDLVDHRKVMGCGLLPEDRDGFTCSFLFRKPASPALAARLEGAEIDPAKIDADLRKLAERFDVVLVEGAGGLMVPLRDDLLTIDYVASRRLPLALVATSKLGGINHALLSIEACKTHGVDLRLVVFNRLPQDEDVMADDSLAAIRSFTSRLFPNAEVIDFRGQDSLAGLDAEALAGPVEIEAPTV